ncbi:uncharacterized protein LOC135216028 [Macrobrachium nipponense]|uniref:uncharacterized protein LOC135216028 n=1 Tax=Macrobrachium nipponense TaxID=159736 RepID=UPI0030C7CFC1
MISITGRKVITMLFCLVALGSATPLPSGEFGGRLQQTSLETREFEAPSGTAVGPRALGAISDSLPLLGQLLTDTNGTPMERISKLSLSFLPAARNIIEARAQEDSNFDKDYALQRQEAAEKVVPNILQGITQFINGLPPATPVPEIFIPPVRTFTFDNPSVPDQTIEGFTIPETEFSPKIVIPDIKIQ